MTPQQPDDPVVVDAPVAQRVTVVTDEGNRYPGWVIRDDLVLVRNLRRTDFCPTVRVEAEGRRLGVLDRVNSAPGNRAQPHRRSSGGRSGVPAGRRRGGATGRHTRSLVRRVPGSGPTRSRGL